MFAVDDFKMGAAEKVNGREAKVIHYRLTLNGKHAVQAALWLDAATPRAALGELAPRSKALPCHLLRPGAERVRHFATPSGARAHAAAAVRCTTTPLPLH